MHDPSGTIQPGVRMISMELWDGPTGQLVSAEVGYIVGSAYGNFDTIFGHHFWRVSQLQPTPTCAVHAALLGPHADWVLIGAWNPMLL